MYIEILMGFWGPNDSATYLMFAPSVRSKHDERSINNELHGIVRATCGMQVCGHPFAGLLNSLFMA